MKWYMTVGVPGGDFAIRTDADSADASLFPHVAGIFGDSTDFACIRPCPPDLVEWIEAEAHGQRGMYAKCAGGWLAFMHAANGCDPSRECAAGAFVPVAGAAGLTIIGDSPST